MNHILYNQETGVIENIIVLEPDNTNYKVPEGFAVISQENIQVFGWVLNYDTAEFEYKTGADIPLEIGFVYKNGVAKDMAERPTPEVPDTVLMKNLRLVLLNKGLLSVVTEYIGSADAKTQILWEYDTYVQRNGELASIIQGALQLDVSAVDKLFICAKGR